MRWLYCDSLGDILTSSKREFDWKNKANYVLEMCDGKRYEGVYQKSVKKYFFKKLWKYFFSTVFAFRKQTQKAKTIFGNKKTFEKIDLKNWYLKTKIWLSNKIWIKIIFQKKLVLLEIIQTRKTFSASKKYFLKNQTLLKFQQ